VLPIYFISSLAEANRAPFDIPESESELIGGYHTEYSGFRWSMLMLSEYAVMLLVSLLGAVLFFGGTAAPIQLMEIETVWLSQLVSAFGFLPKHLSG
jgi:NADH-quinone oxidoreductase subunit H